MLGRTQVWHGAKRAGPLLVGPGVSGSVVGPRGVKFNIHLLPTIGDTEWQQSQRLVLCGFSKSILTLILEAMWIYKLMSGAKYI